MKKWQLLLYIFPTLLFCQKLNDFSGKINYSYAARLSDKSIINLPYRITDIKWQREDDAFSIFSHLAMEYRIPKENRFLENISPQDFIWDLREIYMTWYVSHGEIKIGKQIHSWGSVDANSPTDNLNSYDYYYLFSVGSEQKIGVFSTSGKFYMNSWTIGFSISPIHNTNRLPINDSESPIDIPINPRSSNVLKAENPLEFGAYIRKSFNNSDVTISYFNSYDRIFNLAGINVWGGQGNDTFLDTLFSYMHTNNYGVGNVLFLGDLTMRGEYSLFISKNKTDVTDLIDVKYDNKWLQSFYNEIADSIKDLNYTHAFKSKVKYYQFTLQFEYELPGNTKLTGQWFKYDTVSDRFSDWIDDLTSSKHWGPFYYDNAPDPPDLPLFANNDKGGCSGTAIEECFSPGMGVPIASLSKSIFLFDISKTLYDNQLELNFRSMIDQKNDGKLFEIEISYDITESVKSKVAFNKIRGDASQDNKYTFNNMENFSHFRCDLIYTF